MSTLTSLLDEKAFRIADQVDELGRGTAESLHAAASSVRKGSKAIEDLAESAASKLDGAGLYVENHNAKRAMGQTGQLVRRYPAESILVAAAAGFVSGFAIRRLMHKCDKPATT